MNGKVELEKLIPTILSFFLKVTSLTFHKKIIIQEMKKLVPEINRFETEEYLDLNLLLEGFKCLLKF